MSVAESVSVAQDERPAIAVGHLSLRVPDHRKTVDFLVSLGIREVFMNDEMGILEFRGGTHVLVFPGDAEIEPGTPAPFDLMVDDVDEARRRIESMGLAPSEMRENRVHRSFTVRAPSGHDFTVTSSHAVGAV